MIIYDYLYNDSWAWFKQSLKLKIQQTVSPLSPNMHMLVQEMLIGLCLYACLFLYVCVDGHLLHIHANDMWTLIKHSWKFEIHFHKK